MKHTIVFAALALAGAAVGAQDLARVISSVPVIQQVAVPRQVCTTQPVAVQPPNSGAGAVMGAIAGGAVGNAIGDGSGRAIATMIGLLGGAMLGDRIEGGPSAQVQHVQQCSTQTFYENRTVGYNVTYEYAGRQYTVQLPNEPGPTLRVQVTPVGAAQEAPVAPAYAPPVTTAPAVITTGPAIVPAGVLYPNAYPVPYAAPVRVVTPVYTPVYTPVVAPSYYVRPPVQLSIGIHAQRHWHRAPPLRQAPPRHRR